MFLLRTESGILAYNKSSRQWEDYVGQIPPESEQSLVCTTSHVSLAPHNFASLLVSLVSMQAESDIKNVEVVTYKKQFRNIPFIRDRRKRYCISFRWKDVVENFLPLGEVDEFRCMAVNETYDIFYADTMESSWSGSVVCQALLTLLTYIVKGG